MSITIEQLQGIAGSGHVVTDQGDKVGAIGQIYLDDNTGTPSWVTVKTGLFGTAETFVPVQDARVNDSDLVVAHTKDTIKSAPRVAADGSLSPEEEVSLYRHYGISDTSQRAGVGPDSTGDTSPNSSGWDGTGNVPSDLDDPSEAGDHRPDISDRTVGYDRSGPTTDDAMTRSEERLRVGKQTVETGRARLRKHVVTEQVSQTVPVRKEKLTLQSEPITDANRGPALSGPAISEEEHEVVLREEVPVVDKEVVAVERVRAGKAVVNEQQTVSAQVRKEQIQLEDPQAPSTKKLR